MAVPARDQRAYGLRRKAGARHPRSAAASEARSLRTSATAARFAASTPASRPPTAVAGAGGRDHPVQAVGSGICGPGGVIGGISVGCAGAGVSAGGDEGVGTDGGRPGNSGPGPGGGATGGVSAGSGLVGGKPGNSGGGCCAGSESTRDRNPRRPVAECVAIMRIGTRGGSPRSSPRGGAGHAACGRGFRCGMRTTVSRA
jgi:hypothetical protein